MMRATSAIAETASRSDEHNELLAALPATELARMAPHLELVAMPLGEMLYEPGGQLQYAYFPTTSVVSLHYVTESGASAEIAGVGSEGVVGVSLFMGGDTTPSSAVVQIAGRGYRVSAASLLQEFQHGGVMQGRLLRYTQALLAQITQAAVCNRHHSVDQQLSRWLLLTLDRVPLRELVVTQEQIAGALGVRRESVTEAAGLLRDAGVIGYRRGHIAVLKRAGLETRTCECYNVVRTEMDRLLSSAAGR
jgi:CRP-like cAMP-binding protein